MSDTPVFQRLLPSDRARVRTHFLRLDLADRHLRFFGQVGDAAIEAYCEKILSTGYIVLGCFIDGELRAVGELCPQGRQWNRVAEIAITVEGPYQNHGIGTEMLRRLVRLARNRLINKLHLYCLIDNARMQKVARKLGGTLKFAEGEVEATINPPWPTYWSLMEEALADGRAVMHTWLLDIGSTGAEGPSA